MTPMDDLIARLEGGEGADRELDGSIARVLSGSKDHWFPLAGALMTEETAPRYSASLDAAVAFVERMLPGVTDNSAIDFVHASIGEMFERGFRVDRPATPQMARAVVASMLRALAQKDQDNG